MSIFDKFKKKEQVIDWREMQIIVAGASVRFCITKILANNDK